MKRFLADYIFPVHRPPIKNGVILVDDDGLINMIDDEASSGSRLFRDVETIRISGAIVPGFVNTHCHLELSHLHNKIPRQKGLINFIKNVQQYRHAADDDILKHAEAADKTMYENGIVAVGDVCNSSITAGLKQKSKLYYHSFVEVFGFVPEKAQELMDKAISMKENYGDLSVSVTPHAPYSVSKELFKLLKKYAEKGSNLITIHNQETEEENKLYRYKTGAFLELYAHFGTDISFFKPQARNSLQSIIPLLTDKEPILLVHNTYTSLKDIYFAKRFERNISWCFCPGANLYIENKLPKIDLFLNHNFNITLGTDSLASNTELSILSELKHISTHFPDIPFWKTLPWATINGAKYLGLDTVLGTLEPGKKPGLNVISNMNDMSLTTESTVNRLI